ncbi:MAG: GAF domain-containing protein [Chloroflexota bacterium]
MQRPRAGPGRPQPRDSLGRRMALALLPMVLVPMLIMGAVAYLRARTILQQQVRGEMASAAESQLQLLDTWTTSRQQQIILASQSAGITQLADQMLRLPEGSRTLQSLRSEMHEQLVALRSGAGQNAFSDLLVVRASDGEVLSSTNTAWEGQTLPAMVDGTVAAGELSTRPVYDDSLLAPGQLALVTTGPIRTSVALVPEAVLVGVSSGLRLGHLMEQLQVFWEQRGVFRIERGQTFLVMPPDIHLHMERYATEPTIVVDASHPVLNTDLSITDVISREYTTIEGIPVLGTFQWVPGWGMAVVNEVPQSDVYAGLTGLAPFSAALVGGAALLTVVVVALVTNRLLRPLGALTEFAGRMSRGEWTYRVPEEREDEIGLLAAALNRMAEDLSSLYRTLEARVEERTRQVRTAAEVARAATSIPNLQALLRRAVELICERFGYYHAAIFLLDDSGKNAVLREATGEVGAVLVARRHSLPVGSQSIIGWVTANNQPRVASDVSHDPIHFKNELLPGTRSEAAVPLQVGGRILGALDVQSLEPHAFSPEDLSILQMLADQLSAAIQNARLAERSALAAERARMISEVTSALSALTEVDRVLETTGRFVHQALGQPEILVRLVSPEDGGLPAEETTGGEGQGT